MNPAQVVVMGVSGCGKSTVGERLAAELGVAYVEGDSLHTARNVALMAAGTPLTDDDRRSWLQALADVLAAAAAQAQGIVVSCSALKRSYRDLLRCGAPALRFVWLHGAPELLAERLRARADHFMPVSLLQSQLATLEPPAADEKAVAIDIALPLPAIVAAARRHVEES